MLVAVILIVDPHEWHLDLEFGFELCTWLATFVPENYSPTSLPDELARCTIARPLLITIQTVLPRTHFLKSEVIMSAPNPKAFPLADAALSQQILDLVQQASHHKQLRKGANEGASFIQFHVLTEEEELTLHL